MKPGILIYICVVGFGVVQSQSFLFPKFNLANFHRQNNRAPEDDIHYYLYTKKNPTTPNVLIPGNLESLESSNYNPNASLKIVCHGFTHSSDHPIGVGLRDAFMQYYPEDVNVIVVDWRVLAQGPIYGNAAENTKHVGRYTAQLIDFLIDNGQTDLARVHYLGHSLGSHIGGFIHSYLKAGRPARITALDPALPLFGQVGDDERIDPTDADFVDVIHTAGGTMFEGGLAFREPRGHVDFYPNSGDPPQPGCEPDAFGVCSHDRCFHFFIESIQNPTVFKGCECINWEQFNDGSCTCISEQYMGLNTPTTARGIYFLRTNAQSPYGQGKVKRLIKH